MLGDKVRFVNKCNPFFSVEMAKLVRTKKAKKYAAGQEFVH